MNILSLLNKYDIHPKKSLGQNFLTAIPTLEKIVRRLRSTENDKVLEIGPGPGVMTKMLTENAKFVAAIETDKAMVNILENEWGNISNLHIIHGDILDTNLDKLLTGDDKWLFIGNIPYNITSPLLFHLRKFRNRFRYGLVLIQKEVADRLVAKPRTKDYGILTIGIQSIATVEQLFNVSPSSFYPAPKVESSVVRISFEENPGYNIDDFDHFINLVRAAFSTRRKKLKNAVQQSGFLQVDPEKLEIAMNNIGITENARAEELEISTFAKLSNILKD